MAIFLFINWHTGFYELIQREKATHYLGSKILQVKSKDLYCYTSEAEEVLIFTKAILTRSFSNDSKNGRNSSSWICYHVVMPTCCQVTWGWDKCYNVQDKLALD